MWRMAAVSGPVDSPSFDLSARLVSFLKLRLLRGRLVSFESLFSAAFEPTIRNDYSCRSVRFATIHPNVPLLSHLNPCFSQGRMFRPELSCP